MVRLPEELRALEERLLRPEVRESPDEMAELLDDAFREIGASGETYDKAQALAALAAEPSGTRFELGAFEARALGPEAALVTFTVTKIASDGSRTRSLRSSLWRKRDGRWRLLFHQGTAAPR